MSGKSILPNCIQVVMLWVVAVIDNNSQCDHDADNS